MHIIADDVDADRACLNGNLSTPSIARIITQPDRENEHLYVDRMKMYLIQKLYKFSSPEYLCTPEMAKPSLYNEDEDLCIVFL